MIKNIAACLFVLCLIKHSGAQIYFPPSTPSIWQTVSPQSLGWCVSELDTLTQFLDSTQTKGFIILKDGRIAYEKYFGTFTQDSLWLWASAGKSLFAFLMGQAIDQSSLALNDTVSKYLGMGWTSCSAIDEQKISVKDLLAMTTGLNDNVPDQNCTLPQCLTCLAAPNNRWAYYNAPYTLSHKVLENATGIGLNAFTTLKLKSKTGMGGLWLTIGGNEVYFSRLRDMARFGLLMQNNGIWSSDTLLFSSAYFQQMINSSQALNPAYGLLWWLNGKASYMLPQMQLQIPGMLIPHAPNDTWCALGKDDQKLYIAQSTGLVIARMGNDAGYAAPGPNGYDNQLWSYLNRVFCNTTDVEEINLEKFSIYPNPSQGSVFLHLQSSAFVSVFTTTGICIDKNWVEAGTTQIDLPKGFYWAIFEKNGQQTILKFMID